MSEREGQRKERGTEKRERERQRVRHKKRTNNRNEEIEGDREIEGEREIESTYNDLLERGESGHVDERGGKERCQHETESETKSNK